MADDQTRDPIYVAYPVATEWPDDDRITRRWMRWAYLVIALAGVGAFLISVFWWGPAGLILGLVIGSVFAVNVKMSIRPQWPM